MSDSSCYRTDDKDLICMKYYPQRMSFYESACLVNYTTIGIYPKKHVQIMGNLLKRD